MIVIAIAILNYIAIASDAISDSAIDRKVNVDRNAWHFVKWARYYIPQAIIFYLMYYSELIRLTNIYLIGIIAYVSVGWLIWKIAYISNALRAK